MNSSFNKSIKSNRYQEKIDVSGEMTKISIVIPVFNEAENISPLYEEIVSVLGTIKKDFEIVFVNDGSIDATQEIKCNNKYNLTS